MRYGAIAVIALGASLTSAAQTTAYQDADSHSSLYLMNAKANLVYNVSDSKFTIGYLHEPNTRIDHSVSDLTKLRDFYQTDLDNSNKTSLPPNASPAQKDAYEKGKVFDGAEIGALNDQIEKAKKTGPDYLGKTEWGLSFSAKPSTDLGGQLFQNSNSPASVTGGGSIGIHGIKAGPPVLIAEETQQGKPPLVQDDSFFVFCDFTRSTFDAVPTSSATVTTQHFNGFDILPTYNAHLSHNGWDFLVGVSGGVNRTNNSGDLKKVMINTTNAQSGTISVVTQQSAYMGTYTASIGVPIYSNFVVIPAKAEWLRSISSSGPTLCRRMAMEKVVSGFSSLNPKNRRMFWAE
jgi:hypothetical protein